MHSSLPGDECMTQVARVQLSTAAVPGVHARAQSPYRHAFALYAHLLPLVARAHRSAPCNT